ncbi:MAG: TOBE domain-containing protein [Microthrixaceae bacterium]|nr:TOBE domain-containing protein [Microthrixaceae bacterium]
MRPEHMTLGGSGDTSGLRGTVENIEMLGHERHLLARVGPGVMVARLDPDIEAPAIGEPVLLAVDADKVHLFDAATTLRLDAYTDPTGTTGAMSGPGPETLR